MIKIAFAGAGNMALEHLKAFTSIPGVKPEGIYSRTKTKSEELAQKFDLPIVCHSVSELYHTTKADILVIAVSELAVREVCLEAFKYPWTCLIEKPAGYNYSDAEFILNLAQSNNTKAYVALNRRHYSATRQILNDLSKSDQSRLIHVFDQEDPKAGLAAGRPQLVSDNWMYANSIHMIDYFHILGRGKIISVENIIQWDPKHPGFVLSKINYDSGDIGIYEAVWNAPGPWAVTVTTHAKRWEIRPLEQASVQLYGSRKQELFPVDVRDTDFKPGLRLQAEELIRAISGSQHALPTLADAFESMKLVKALYFENE